MTTENPPAVPPADEPTEPAKPARATAPKSGDVVELENGDYALVVGKQLIVRLGPPLRHELPLRKVG